MVEGEYVTSETAAEMLSITTNHLRQIQWRGALKWSSKNGNRVFYARADVEQYLEKRNLKKNKNING
jgi:predicted site-specific integrase-resolvase